MQDQIEEENEEKLRKNEREYRRMRMEGILISCPPGVESLLATAHLWLRVWLVKWLHPCLFTEQESISFSPNFTAFLNLVKIKTDCEYKIAESKGKLKYHFRKWTLNIGTP